MIQRILTEENIAVMVDEEREELRQILDGEREVPDMSDLPELAPHIRQSIKEMAADILGSRGITSNITGSSILEDVETYVVGENDVDDDAHHDEEAQQEDA